MSEKDFQERTEQPTPKRREDARKRGQVARSRELVITTVMLAGAGFALISRGHFATIFEDFMRRGLAPDPRLLGQPDAMTRGFASAGIDMLLAFVPLMAVLFIAAIAGGLAVGGWAFSAEQFTPKLERLSPVKGIKRIFSLRGLVEVAKALAKALVIGGFALLCMAWARGQVLSLGIMPLGFALDRSAQLLAVTLLVCSLGMLLIAMADVPFQMWSHVRELRMTRQEIRDELKESEGRPEVRSRIRSLQQQLANRRMMKALPTADVVITNPTHFAVALRYDEGRMRAPVVVAKGADHVAARIRDIAGKHRITLFEAPLLARALYWTTNINQEIPGPLYVAVAQVLTYVYRLKAAAQGGAPWPERPVVKVDASLARPRHGHADGLA